MMICADDTPMHWTDEERAELASSDFPRKDEWLGLLPSGLHFRPLGNKSLAVLWEYVHLETPVSDPPHPEPTFDSFYPEIVVRGLTSIIPDFQQYIGATAKGLHVDGGYYCKTIQNMPIVDAYRSLRGAYVAGAYSGFGIMSSPALAELMALRILGKPLPDYAQAFEIESHRENLRRAAESGHAGSRHKEVQL